MIEDQRSSTKITATLEFSDSGFLKSVCLNASTDTGQETLEKALRRLIIPGHFSWMRRLFTK